MKSSVAVCTMLYNEPEFLPIWLKYYGQQLGIENCFVIDHGSEIVAKDILAAKNLISIARSPQNELQRVEAISDYAGYLLSYYETVIYVDIDEILVANPNLYAGLKPFCESLSAEATTAVGLNIHHIASEEPPFDPATPVLSQRSWVRFVSPMCKPAIVKSKVRWGRGFHSCDKPVSFGDVYLFHLRSFDVDVALARLARTRILARFSDRDEKAAAHQRLQDAEYLAMTNAITQLPREEPQAFSLDAPPIMDAIRSALPTGSNQIANNLFAQQLWKVPASFRGTF